MKFILLACLIGVLTLRVAGQVDDFCSINFRKADSIAFLYPNHSLQDLRKLAYKLTASLNTDVEKFRAIYRWTCENISYDYALFKKNKRQREKLQTSIELDRWNRRMNVLSFQALLQKHRTVCTGYAYLLRELARHVNIECEIVDGYGRTAISNVGGNGIPNHQWTRVKLNNKWYLCDATWSSGSMLTSENRYVKEFIESYFLMDPKLFVRNHYPIDTVWTLLPKSPSLKQFLDGPLVYKKSFELKPTHLWPETFDIVVNKKEDVNFRFKAEKDRLDFISLAVDGQVKTVYKAVSPDAQGIFSVSQQFSSRGTYVVDIIQNNQYLFSYRVTVR